MTRYDEPEWQTQERSRATIARVVGDYTGNLELTLSEREIELSKAEVNETLYSVERANGKWYYSDRLRILQNVINGVGRRGYSPSALSRITLKLGFIPKKLNSK